MGASSDSSPDSTSCMAATAVTGLVIDAILKIVSSVMSTSSPTRALPNAPAYRISSAFATIATTPGTRPSSTAVARIWSIVSAWTTPAMLASRTPAPATRCIIGSSSP